MSNMHLYPLGKGGDPLCPLGFHPQVRWPTRCKRCFRDYKEHGGKRQELELRKDEIAASTPSLRSFNLQDNDRIGWQSSSNLATDKSSLNNDYFKSKNPSSWTSTPDLANLQDSIQANIPTVSLTLPLRRKIVVDTGQHKNDIPPKSTVLNGKEHFLSSNVVNETKQKALTKNPKRIHIKEIQTPLPEEESASNDVQFIIKVKSKSKKPYRLSGSSEGSDSDHDNISVAGSETTESTTLVDHLEFDLKHQLKNLREELKVYKEKAERLEKEKSNILLRRFTAMDTKKGSSTEVMKLQQKVNELQVQMEEYNDENKVLNIKVKELEDDLESRSVPVTNQKITDELRSKLIAAENLCEELMDENEDMKKELREMEDEMEEMQDNFREDQADEYTSLKKELEQTTKNCRILSFKLRKTERKAESLEHEKIEVDKKLKEVTTGIALKVEPKNIADKEKFPKLKGSKFSEMNTLNATKKGSKLEGADKTSSGDTVPRESLTRGGSQEDPVQLMRDLQDSLEREADLKEQLKFAEEEAQSFRKKSTRFEEENESLTLQLKKMATRTKTNRKSSEIKDTNDSKEKDEDLKLQLELSEQEALILRKKLEDIEIDNERHKKEINKFQEKSFTDKINFGNKDKSKVIENEINELRRKLLEKESICKAQEAKIKLLNEVKTEKIDQKNVDLKEQLTLIEKEVAVFRVKAENLENENEKLLKENKRLTLTKSKVPKNDKQLEVYLDQIVALETELNNLKTENKELSEKMGKDDSSALTKRIKVIEKERDKLQIVLDNIKESSPNIFKNRKSCVVSDTTPKSQLKIMVNNLEMEIASMLIVMDKLENSPNSKSYNNDNLMKEYKDLEAKKADAENEISKTREVNLSLCKEKEEIQDKMQKVIDENKQLTTNILKLDKLSEEFAETKESYESKLSKKNTDIKKIKNELEEKKALIIDLNSSSDKVKELEKQCKNNDRKLKESEKNYVNKINDLEKMLAEAKEDKLSCDTSLNELLNKSKLKYEELEAQNNQIKERISLLEITIKEKDSQIKLIESDLEKQKLTANKSGDGKIIKELRQELAKLKTNMSDKEKNLQEYEQNKAKLIENSQRIENELKVKNKEFDNKMNDMQTKYENSLRTHEQNIFKLEKEIKKKEIEMTLLTQKVKNLESSLSSSRERELNIDEMKKKLEAEKKNYENLTSKYEVLEEEHVVTKAELVTEKEQLKSQIANYQREIAEIKSKNLSLESSIRDLQKEKKELLLKTGKNATDLSQNLEKLRFKTLLEGQQTETDQLKKQCDVLNDQMDFMRRENDELKQKIDDYNKVSKIQRNMSADSAAMEKQIKELNMKLLNMEKNKTLNISDLKLRYENQTSILNKEMHSLHAQISRFRREKDTYKQMLDGAQKTIGELKINPEKNTLNPVEDVEEYKSKVAGLEQQINCMEDELFDARLEASKLKTEFVSEKSSWEVQISELHSKINEIEEERILSGGRTKIAGVRTRMELSWQKEREEQQRLLQETATLARDLRQTLFEIERERDKENLESKRKLQQLKKAMEEDQEENKRKLVDVQSDFMELRDAHAKLRTTNDKLRREKERYEKEREEMKSVINGKKRVDHEDTKKLNLIISQVENLIQLAPELFGSKADVAPYTPTPPKRTKSKSREGSPVMDRRVSSRESSVTREDKKTKINTTLQSLLDATEELKKIQNRNDENRDKERVKRYSIRRATSTENDRVIGSTSSIKQKHKKSVDSNLTQKSLSLEHTASLNDYKIWKGDDGSISSLQSLNSDYRRDKEYSIDSRMSDGSTKSEMTSDKKKKGFINKIKKLTKSRSIDDTDNDFFSPNRPLSSKNNSSADIEEDMSGSKNNLKERITGMFKRGKSSSRSNSVERQVKHDTSSTQRPLMGIPSTTNH